MQSVGTIVWTPGVCLSSISLAKARAFSRTGAQQGVPLAGGGDTLAAIEKRKVEGDILHLDGWRRILGILEGKTLPAVADQARARDLASG